MYGLFSNVMPISIFHFSNLREHQMKSSRGGEVQGKFRNFTVFQHILLQYAAIQKPQKGRDKLIHFLKAMFTTNLEIDISRPYLWGYLLYSAPKITTSQQMRRKGYSLNPPIAKGNGCNRPPLPPPPKKNNRFSSFS